jgi:hypothetical protein
MIHFLWLMIWVFLYLFKWCVCTSCFAWDRKILQLTPFQNVFHDKYSTCHVSVAVIWYDEIIILFWNLNVCEISKRPCVCHMFKFVTNTIWWKCFIFFCRMWHKSNIGCNDCRLLNILVKPRHELFFVCVGPKGMSVVPQCNIHDSVGNIWFMF